MPFYTNPPDVSSTYTPWTSSTTPHIDIYDCTGFCQNGGLCTLTGPGRTAVCSCSSNFRGQHCEETVLWFEYFVKDNKLTGNGFAALFCIGVSLAILTFAGVIVYRRYKHRKSKAREKEKFHESVGPRFNELASRQELIVYQVAQPVPPRRSPPRSIPSSSPLSPHHVTRGSRDTHSSHSEAATWQDFHNPGYRQSYIDTII